MMIVIQNRPNAFIRFNFANKSPIVLYNKNGTVRLFCFERQGCLIKIQICLWIFKVFSIFSGAIFFFGLKINLTNKFLLREKNSTIVTMLEMLGVFC